MQIVIDIDENVFTRLFDNGIEDNEIAVDDVCEMARALRLGTPLDEVITDRVEYGADGNAYRLTISNGKELEQEPKTGHWIKMPIGFKCSECNELEDRTTKYCPDCGAKMVDPQEGEEV